MKTKRFYSEEIKKIIIRFLLDHKISQPLYMIEISVLLLMINIINRECRDGLLNNKIDNILIVEARVIIRISLLVTAIAL